GLQNSDTVTSVTLNSSGYAASATVVAPGPTYTITPSAAVFGVGAAGNYSITYATTGAITVTKAALTLAATNQTKVYGTAVTPAGTEFTATGLQNSDSVASVTLSSPGYAASATVIAPGPTYTITPSAAVFGVGAAGNYRMTYATTGAITVT